MHPRPWRFCSGMVAVLALLAGSEARAQLSRRSPFDSQETPRVSAISALPLEFAGFIQTRDGLQFRVHDPMRKRAAFVQLDVRDAELDVVAREYDSENGALIVEHQGRTLTLPERKPKIQTAGALQPPSLNVPPRVITPATVRPSASPGPGASFSPATNPERLKAVQDELVRRQQERARAAAAAK